MDRAKFLVYGKAIAVPLVPFTIPGFPEPIYLKRSRLSDVKAQLIREDESQDVRVLLRKDEFYVERSLARIMRDESGELLFDETDDSQMKQLREIADEWPSGTSALIQTAAARTVEADKEEVDPKGN